MTVDSQAEVIRRPQMVRSPRTVEFWAAADDGRLLLQRCESCGHLQHYARSICTACWSDTLCWHQSAGLGAVWTYTIIGTPGHPAWNPDVPYVVAVVELDDGPRVLTNIIECEPGSVFIGQRVRLCPTHRPDIAQTLLTFRPDAATQPTARASTHPFRESTGRD